MNKRRWVLVSIAIIFTIVGWASSWVFADPSETEKAAQQLKMASEYAVEGIRNFDYNEDGTTDTLVIYGKKENKADIYVEDIQVALIDGETSAVKRSQLESFSGYEPKIYALTDFTGDQKPEVFLGADTGGSGGYSTYAILDFNQNSAVNIFTADIAEGLKIRGKYLDGFQALIEVEPIQRAFKMDFKGKKAFYLEHQIYKADGTYIGDQGESGTPNEIFGYPFGSLEAQDVDGDGISELLGSQRLIGVNNIERLSHVDSVLSYKEGKWQCVEASYRTYIR